jgi:predicted HTH transcriptional regulator
MKIDNLEILNGLIAGAEGGTVEFKETTGQLERGIETLCAFLNGTGGTVLFGVSANMRWFIIFSVLRVYTCLSVCAH